MTTNLKTCISEWFDTTDYNTIIYNRSLVMLSQVIMSVMLHALIEPNTTKALNMAKFALNHPERFQKHHWGLAFSAGMAKAIVNIATETLNACAMIQQCDMIYVIYAFIRYWCIEYSDWYFYEAL
jgi:hypothetical protein